MVDASRRSRASATVSNGSVTTATEPNLRWASTGVASSTSSAIAALSGCRAGEAVG